MDQDHKDIIREITETLVLLFSGSHPQQSDIDDIKQKLFEHSLTARDLIGGNADLYNAVSNETIPRYSHTDSGNEGVYEANLAFWLSKAAGRIRKIESLRENFSDYKNLPSGTDFDERHASLYAIKKGLEEINANWSSLDPKGRKNANEILREVDGADVFMRAEALREARAIYGLIDINYRLPDYKAADKIVELMKIAGLPLDYIDRSWKTGEGEVKIAEFREKEQARCSKSLYEARGIYRTLQTAKNRPPSPESVDKIIELLDAAGYDFDNIEDGLKPGEGAHKLSALKKAQELALTQHMFQQATSGNWNDMPYALPLPSVMQVCAKYHITLPELFGHPDMPEDAAKSLLEQNMRIWNLRQAFYLDVKMGTVPFMRDTIQQHLVASQLANEISDCSSDSTNALMPFLNDTERANTPAATMAHLARLRKKYLDR